MKASNFMEEKASNLRVTELNYTCSYTDIIIKVSSNVLVTSLRMKNYSHFHIFSRMQLITLNQNILSILQAYLNTESGNFLEEKLQKRKVKLTKQRMVPLAICVALG